MKTYEDEILVNEIIDCCTRVPRDSWLATYANCIPDNVLSYLKHSYIPHIIKVPAIEKQLFKVKKEVSEQFRSEVLHEYKKHVYGYVLRHLTDYAESETELNYIDLMKIDF